MEGHRDELLAIGALAMNHTTGNLADTIANSTAEERAVLVSLIEAGQAAGQLRPLDAGVMAAVIAKSVESALEEWAWRPETDLAAYADELVELFARGMRRTDR